MIGLSMSVPSVPGFMRKASSTVLSVENYLAIGNPRFLGFFCILCAEPLTENACPTARSGDCPAN